MLRAAAIPAATAITAHASTPQSLHRHTRIASTPRSVGVTVSRERRTAATVPKGRRPIPNSTPVPPATAHRLPRAPCNVAQRSKKVSAASGNRTPAYRETVDNPTTGPTRLEIPTGVEPACPFEQRLSKALRQSESNGTGWGGTAGWCT